MNKSLNLSDDDPKFLASSVEGVMSVSNLANAEIVSDVALPRLIAPLRSVCPLTVKLSSTVTVPPAESIVRFPEAVSISLSPVTPT